MVKISTERLDYLIEDEWKAYNEYKSLGLNNLAKDELKHYNFLKKLREKRN